MSEGGPHVTEVHAGAKSRRRTLMHAAFAIAGIAAMALLVRSVGLAALLAALRASARWLPLLFALELGRAALEAAATYSLSARVRAAVPPMELARAHVIAYAVSAVMPAGRATGEAVKAALLSRFVGAPEAAAIAAGNESAVLFGGAIAALPCAVAAAFVTGGSAFTWGLVAFALGSAALSALFQLACRRRDIGGSLLRRFTRMEDAPAAFRDAMTRIPLVPIGATAAAIASRALFAFELAALLHAAGGSAGRALVALGVSLVGGALGEVVPGQLGASDGAFALAAPALAITRADGIAIAMTLHVVQVAWGVVGGTAPFWWRASASREPKDPAGVRRPRRR